jgi:hypothetical protein
MDRHRPSRQLIVNPAAPTFCCQRYDFAPDAQPDDLAADVAPDEHRVGFSRRLDLSVGAVRCPASSYSLCRAEGSSALLILCRRSVFGGLDSPGVLQLPDTIRRHADQHQADSLLVREAHWNIGSRSSY